MNRQCNESPPGQLLQAIREFNNRDWFECHETVDPGYIPRIKTVLAEST